MTKKHLPVILPRMEQTSQSPTRVRDPYWDAVKGLLIILVVLGHAVQLAGGGNFWGQPLFKGIYLFHMPLFVMVSGYFGIIGVRRHGRGYVWRNAKHLLVPSLVTALVYLAYGAGRACAAGEPLPVPGYGDFLRVWFLICIFECSLFTWILLLFKSLWWRAAWFVVPMVLAMVCPGFPHPGQFTFLYPFFLLGAWAQARGWRLQTPWVGVAAFAVYACIFWLFHENWYVYRAPMASLPDNPYVVAIYLVRMAGGVAGCFLFLFIVRRLPWLQNCSLLQKLGGSTLAIYLLQCYFWDFVWIGHFPAISVWLCLPLTALVVALCYGIHQLCRRAPVLAFLMFGEQGSKHSNQNPSLERSSS